MDQAYRIGAVITGLITFLVAYVYCMAEYGLLLGVGFGWVPSIIVAVVAAFAWPLIALAIVGFILLLVAGR